MNTQTETTLGSFTYFSTLNHAEQALVREAWDVAERAYTPRSHFPVGAAILAQNDYGKTRLLSGCNVENRFFGATICAERNAATTAVALGYSRFLAVALVLKHYHGPDSSPCGLCRQVLTEFGTDTVVLQVADQNSNVLRYTVADLLPAASGPSIVCRLLPAKYRGAVKRLNLLRARVYAPYSKKGHTAVFLASNLAGSERRFDGITDENASYGGTAAPELVAMRSARAAGYVHNVCLVVQVVDIAQTNPIEGHCLQVLREFGEQAQVLLVDHSGSCRFSSVFELLPNSFGPHALL